MEHRALLGHRGTFRASRRVSPNKPSHVSSGLPIRFSEHPLRRVGNFCPHKGHLPSVAGTQGLSNTWTASSLYLHLRVMRTHRSMGPKVLSVPTDTASVRLTQPSCVLDVNSAEPSTRVKGACSHSWRGPRAMGGTRRTKRLFNSNNPCRSPGGHGAQRGVPLS